MEVGYTNVSQCIEQVPSQDCPVCKNKMNPQNQRHGKVVCIYSEYPTENSPIVTINQIEPNLIFDETVYNLTGIVSYEHLGQMNYSSSGHFVSYCKNKQKWGRYDDLKKYAAAVRNINVTRVNPHMIVYTRSQA